jgi:hypothetical protein
MTFTTSYTIPETPPAELLAELDAASVVLDRLTARAAELTLAMDEETRSLRIGLAERGSDVELTPSQLFALLAAG